MALSVSALESRRADLLRRFLSLGDFRPGSVAAIARRCGKKGCHCARPHGEGHPQLRLHRKVGGKSVAESLATPAAAQRAIEEVNEYHRFQDLVRELTAVSEQICRLRPPKAVSSGWTEEEKERLLRSSKRSRGKSRRSSR